MIVFVKKLDENIVQHRKSLRLLFKRLRVERGISLLPNIFTLGNAFFGLCSIVFSGYREPTTAAYFILLGALMDALDGRIARYARVTSDLGVQLDSLCDGVSFCVAPAVLIFTWQLEQLGSLGFLACAVFLLCGLLRLAKFNLTHTQQRTFFSGTPTTIAGCFLTSIVLATHTYTYGPLSLLLLLFLVIVLGLLMISKIPFPTFKQLPQKIYKFVFIGIVATVITMGFVCFLLILFIAYFLFAFVEYAKTYIQNFNKQTK